MALDAIYRKIQQEAAGAVVVASSMRGIRRRELALSSQRLRALLTGRNLEVTLERTLAALKSRWFNQLNAAGGVGGGNGFNRAAVDLGRFYVGAGLRCVALKELKSWTATDTPREAVEEVFAYCAWLLALRRRGVSPYERDAWALDRVQLHVIAPEEYFRSHGGVATACEVLRHAEVELAALRVTRPELSGVAVAPAPIVLARRFGEDDFVRCFDTDAVNCLLRSGRSAASALEVLRPEAIPALGEWLHDALAQAGAA